jgi:uncharacterized repeat protein (TIGR04052 family)
MRPVLQAAVFATALSSLVAACGDSSGGDIDVEIPFSAVAGQQQVACGVTYANIGTTQSTFSILDFKIYVTDVALVTKSGTEVPVVLEQDGQDGKWQRDAIALLDFEDGTGDCDTGSPEINRSIRGTAPSGDYTAVRFTIGLPPELNHLDAATAPSPLNVPGMWWSWKGGYKFLRLDVKTRGNPSYYLHLGSSACTGDSVAGYSCAAGNTPRITVGDFRLGSSTVSFDIAKLWAEVDLDRPIDLQTDFVHGCMSSATDPECPTVMQHFGLQNGVGGEAQNVFVAE